MTRRGIYRQFVAISIVASALWFLSFLVARSYADDQQSMLASVVSRLLSSPDVSVRVGSVEGALSAKATIRDITLADREGVFLSVDHVQLDWRRAALLSRRLEVDQLVIGKIDWRRRKSGTDAPPAKSEPLLPELPLKLQIKAFELIELVIAEPVMGQSARIAAKGHASLGPPAEGLDAELSIKRLDQEANAMLRLAFVPKGERLSVALEWREPEGGLAARLGSFPGLPAVQLALNGQGPLDDWRATVSFKAGDDINAGGSASIKREGPARRIAIDLRGRLEALLPPVVAGLFPGDVLLDGTATARDDGSWLVERMGLASGLAKLELGGLITPDRTLDLTAQLAARPGKDRVARYLNTTIGALSLEASIKGAIATPKVQGTIQARDVTHPDLKIAQADATFDVAVREPAISSHIAAKARVNGASIAGWTFASAEMLADTTEQGTAVSFDARGGAAAIAAKMVVRPGDETQVALSHFSATRGPANLRLLAPAAITVKEGDAHVAGMRFAVGGGSLRLDGHLGRTLGLRIDASRISLSTLGAFAPQLAIKGMADAKAELGGTISAPTGPYRIDLRQLEHSALRQAGLTRLDISARGTLAGDKANLEATIKGPSGVSIAMMGYAPLRAVGSLDLGVKGVVNAALANSQLAVGQRITGSVRIDGTIKGTIGKPRMEGAATVSGGSFTDAVQGLRLTNLTGRIVGAGERLTIERMTASTPGDGSLMLTGSLLMDHRLGLPVELAIAGRKARLIENDVVIMETDLDLTVRGPLAGVPTIGGVVRIQKMDVLIPDRFAANGTHFHKATHLDAPPETRARLAAQERQRKTQEQRRVQRHGGARLGIRLDAPRRIAVRGRGIDAELGGSLQLEGTLHAPRTTGKFELRRGQIDLLTQRLDFSQGRITFSGDMIPDLDFAASTTAGDITAKLAVTGRADQPVFTLSSQPDLPSDEVLARLMFERAAGSLSPFQAIQLAQAVARLSGKSGFDVLDKARKAVGLDTLDVGANAKGVSVGASRYVTRNIRLGVKTGATPDETGVSAHIDVTRRIKLKGEATRDGRSSVGIAAEIEY